MDGNVKQQKIVIMGNQNKKKIEENKSSSSCQEEAVVFSHAWFIRDSLLLGFKLLHGLLKSGGF